MKSLNTHIETSYDESTTMTSTAWCFIQIQSLSTEHPRSSLSERTAPGARNTADKSKKISSKDSLLRRWRCSASWFVQNDDFFFIYSTHAHTKRATNTVGPHISEN